MPSAKAIWTAFLAGLDPELRAEFAADDTWVVPMVEGVLAKQEAEKARAAAAAAVVADQEIITGHFPGNQQSYRTVLEVTGIDPDNERVAAVSAPGRVTLFPDYWGQIPLPVREAIQRSYGPVDLRESIDRLPLSDIWAGDTFEVSGALLVTVPNAPLAIYPRSLVGGVWKRAHMVSREMSIDYAVAGTWIPPMTLHTIAHEVFKVKEGGRNVITHTFVLRNRAIDQTFIWSPNDIDVPKSYRDRSTLPTFENVNIQRLNAPAAVGIGGREYKGIVIKRMARLHGSTAADWATIEGVKVRARLAGWQTAIDEYAWDTRDRCPAPGTRHYWEMNVVGQTQVGTSTVYRLQRDDGDVYEYLCSPRTWEPEAHQALATAQQISGNFHITGYGSYTGPAFRGRLEIRGNLTIDGRTFQPLVYDPKVPGAYERAVADRVEARRLAAERRAREEQERRDRIARQREQEAANQAAAAAAGQQARADEARIRQEMERLNIALRTGEITAEQFQRLIANLNTLANPQGGLVTGQRRTGTRRQPEAGFRTPPPGAPPPPPRRFLSDVEEERALPDLDEEPVVVPPAEVPITERGQMLEIGADDPKVVANAVVEAQAYDAARQRDFSQIECDLTDAEIEARHVANQAKQAEELAKEIETQTKIAAERDRNRRAEDAERARIQKFLRESREKDKRDKAEKIRVAPTRAGEAERDPFTEDDLTFMDRGASEVEGGERAAMIEFDEQPGAGPVEAEESERGGMLEFEEPGAGPVEPSPEDVRELELDSALDEATQRVEASKAQGDPVGVLQAVADYGHVKEALEAPEGTEEMPRTASGGIDYGALAKRAGERQRAAGKDVLWK